MQPSRPEWEIRMWALLQKSHFQKVQEARRKSAPSVPALSQHISSSPARDSAMVSVQCWPELMWQGHDHIVQTLAEKSWFWVSNGSFAICQRKSCSLGFSLGICKAALCCVATLSLLKGTFRAVWVDVQFKHMQPLSANLKVWPSVFFGNVSY